MIPLDSIATVRDVAGPAIVNRYQMYRSAEVNDAPAPGVNSGQAIEIMEQVARIISDNGSQFVAKDFKEFIRLCGPTHVLRGATAS